MPWLSQMLENLRRRRRRDRNRQPLDHLRPFEPSIRRLEDRRVLDVTAAFATATGQLDVLITNTADTAAISVTAGNIVITNAANQIVPISIDGGAAGPVNAGSVEQFHAQGDAAANQVVRIDSQLNLVRGLVMEASIELAELRGDIRFVASGSVVINAQQNRLGADIDTVNQDISFGGTVTLIDDATLAGRDITFAGTINDDGVAGSSSNLLVNAAGLTRFGASIGGSAELTSVTTDAAGRTELNGNVTTTSGQLFADSVMLTSNAALVSGGATGIVFGNTIDSAVGGLFSLAATTSNGRVEFNGSLGAGANGDQRLGALTVTEATGGVVFGATSAVPQIKTAGPIDLGVGANAIGGTGIVFHGGLAGLFVDSGGGSVRLNGPVILDTDTTIVSGGGSITFTSAAPIDSQNNLTQSLALDAGAGAIFFNADLGGQQAVRGLTISRADGGATFGVTQVHSVDAITIGAGSIIFNGGSGTLRMTTTGDDVLLNGPVTLNSGLSIDTGVGPGDIRFRAGPINSQAGENNDLLLNAGLGSAAFAGSLGSTQPLGALTITRADGGATFDGAQVTARGAIDVGVGPSEIAGTGIVLNSANVTSQTDDVRLNGPVILDTHVTITSGGDITFTNDSPIDSRTGEANNLTLDATAGRIAFNENLGATTPLGSLTVIHARDGVLLGGSINEFPGTGGLGPVEFVQLDGALDLGTGTNVIGGVGIVLSGSAIAPLFLSTTNDTVRMNGPVTLNSDVDISTGTTGANITFTNAASIDGNATRGSRLTFAAGAGAIAFNEDIGVTTPLGGMTVFRADGGLFFGGADDESTGAGGAGPVNAFNASQFLNLGVTAAGIVGGIHFNGGSTGAALNTTDQFVRINGPVRLQSDLAIDTGDGRGDVIFTNSATIDSHDGPAATALERNDLFLDAGDGAVIFNANIGGLQAIDKLTIDRAAKGLTFGLADVANPGGSGPVTLVRTDGAIDLGDGATADDVLGPVLFNGGASKIVFQTSGDDIRVNGPTTLQSDVSIVTEPGSGDLTFTNNAPIDGQSGEVRALELTLDAGDARFDATIGGGTRLGDFVIHSARNVDLNGATTVARLVQEAGNGRTTLNAALNTNHATQTGVDLAGTAFTIDAPVTSTGDGRVTIRHSGLLDINPAGDFRIDGSFADLGGGPTQLAGDIVTSGDAIAFNAPVILTDGSLGLVILDTTSGGSTTGAAVSFNETLDGQTAGAENLSINSGTANDVLFGAAVGKTTRLGSITVPQADDVRFVSTLTAARVVQTAGRGTTTFGGAVDLNHPTLGSLDISALNILIGGPVTTAGNGGVRIDAMTSLDIADAANMTLNGSFAQEGAATVRTSANITTTNDDITFSGPVILRDDVRFSTGAGAGNVLLAQTVNSDGPTPRDLTLNVGTGDVAIVGDAGVTNAFDAVLIESARHLTITGDVQATSFAQQTGTGATAITGDVTTTGATGVQVTTDDLFVTGVIDARGGNGPIVLTAADDLGIGGKLLTNAGPLTLRAGDDLAFGSTGLAQTTTGNVAITAGGSAFMADGAVANAGSGTLALTAAKDVTIGRLLTTSSATITSTAGAILDGGDVDGADVVANAAVFQAARGIGTDAAGSGKTATPANRIETEIGTIAALNTTTGGIHLKDAAVGTQTIGTVNGVSGIENRGGGPIELIHAGTIDIDSPILNRGGGDSSIRAEFVGDLIVDAPIQNTGGHGSIFLKAGGDLVIRNSLPEPPGRVERPANPQDFFEIMVVGQGSVRGEATGDVRIDKGDTNFVIVHTDSGQITNVAPLLKIETIDQGGSDVDERGVGILEVTIGDATHLETNFHIQVDWGDGEIESFPIPGTISPRRLITGPDMVDYRGNLDPRFVSGEAATSNVLGSGVYRIQHKYFENPDPNDQSAPIPIRVQLRYDARASGTVFPDGTRPVGGSAIFNGISFVNQSSQEIVATERAIFTVPGVGNTTFIKVIESVIVPVELRTVATSPVFQTVASFSSTTGLRVEFTTVTIEDTSQAEYRLFLRVVNDVRQRVVDQTTQRAMSAVTSREATEDIELDLELLNDPLSLFRSREFPNGHYRVYLEELSTKRVRLILDIHIFNGKVVPENFREGSGEKQPGADEQPAPAQPAVNDMGRADLNWDARVRDVLAGEPRLVSRAARVLRGN